MGISVIKAPAKTVYNHICDTTHLKSIDTNLQVSSVLLYYKISIV